MFYHRHICTTVQAQWNIFFIFPFPEDAVDRSKLGIKTAAQGLCQIA